MSVSAKASSESLVGGTPDPLFVATIDGQRFITPTQHGHGSSTARNAFYTLSPNGGYSAGAFGSTAINFRLTPSLCKQINQSFLVMVCSETGGANSVTPVVAPYLIDRIEIGINGQPASQQTIYADFLYSQFAMYDSEDLACLVGGNSLNMTTAAFAGESAIPPNGSATYAIPLTGIFINRVNADTFGKDLFINVFPRASPVSAGTGTLQLTSINIQLVSKEDPRNDQRILGLYKSNAALLPYTFINASTYTGTLTAGAQLEFQLTGSTASAQAPAMFIMVRSSKVAAGSAIRSFTPLGGTSEAGGLIDVVKESKTSLLGAGPISTQLIRFQLSPLWFDGLMSAAVPIYWIVFGTQPVRSIVAGADSGGIVFTGKEFLRITPGAGFATGTYTVDVYFMSHADMSLVNGNFSRLA